MTGILPVEAVDVDREWCDRWERDPVSAMAELVSTHRRAIYARARRICGPDRAADVAQEVYLRVWQNPARFRPSRGPLPAFLMLLTSGIAIDVVRRDARRTQRDAHAAHWSTRTGGDPFADVDPVASERLRQALAGLDRRQRDALIAAYVDQLVHREIANTQSIPEGTVKSRIRLGLQHMRELLRDEPDAPSVRCT